MEYEYKIRTDEIVEIDAHDWDYVILSATDLLQLLAEIEDKAEPVDLL